MSKVEHRTKVLLKIIIISQTCIWSNNAVILNNHAGMHAGNREKNINLFFFYVQTKKTATIPFSNSLIPPIFKWTFYFSNKLMQTFLVANKRYFLLTTSLSIFNHLWGFKTLMDLFFTLKEEDKKKKDPRGKKKN